MVASHTAAPLGGCEMAGMRLPPIISACLYGRRHEQLLSLTYSKVPGVWFVLPSHLLSLASRTVTVGSKHPRAFLYGWLPLSDAYRHPLCKQPNGILSLLTAPCMLPTASFLLTITIRCLWHPLLLGIANARLIAIELRTRNNGDL